MVSTEHSIGYGNRKSSDPMANKISWFHAVCLFLWNFTGTWHNMIMKFLILLKTCFLTAIIPKENFIEFFYNVTHSERDGIKYSAASFRYSGCLGVSCNSCKYRSTSKVCLQPNSRCIFLFASVTVVDKRKYQHLHCCTRIINLGFAYRLKYITLR